MNLVEQAESDLSFTLEDSVNGFGIDFIIVDPDKNEYSLTGQTTDIGFFIDPGTGVGVNGSYAEVTFRLSSFVSEGGTKFPERLDGWFIKNVSINSIESTKNYSMQIAPIDRKLGIMKMIVYKAQIK